MIAIGKLPLIGATGDGMRRTETLQARATRVVGVVVPIVRNSTILACTTNLSCDSLASVPLREPDNAMVKDDVTMQTPKDSTRLLNSTASACTALAIACCTSGLIATSFMGTSSVAIAQHPEPINRLGRVAGAGWSDGYHACEPSGTRFLADLPPTSFTNRLDVARLRLAAHRQPLATAHETYYDRFDKACDEAAACDGAAPYQNFVPESPSVPYSGYRQPQPMLAPTPEAPSMELDEREYQDPVALKLWREQERRYRELSILEEQRRVSEMRVFEKYKVEDQAETGSSLTERLPSESSDIIDISKHLPSGAARELETDSSEELPAAKGERAGEDLLEPSPSDQLDSASRRSTSTSAAIVLSELLTPKTSPTRLPKAAESPKIPVQPEPSDRVATIESLIIRQPK